jgi:hypothetical protein
MGLQRRQFHLIVVCAAPGLGVTGVQVVLRHVDRPSSGGLPDATLVLVLSLLAWGSGVLLTRRRPLWQRLRVRIIMAAATVVTVVTLTLTGQDGASPAAVVLGAAAAIACWLAAARSCVERHLE